MRMSLLGKVRSYARSHAAGGLALAVVLWALCPCTFAFAKDGKYREERIWLAHGPNRMEVVSAATLIDRAKPNRYTVRNLFDNDESTTWVTKYKKEAPYREGGLLRIIFEKPVYAKSISIGNGYQKSEKLFHANQRAKVLNIEKVIIGDQPLPYEYTVGLEDKLGKQEISLQEGWVQSINLLKTKEIVINILEVFEGTAYEDLCISELIVHYSDRIEYSPSVPWVELKELISKNATKGHDTWDWDELAKNDYRLFNDLMYYALVGNKEAYALFESFSPREHALSAELKNILKRAVRESVKKQ